MEWNQTVWSVHCWSNWVVLRLLTGKSLRRNESAGSFQTAVSVSASSLQEVGVSMPSTPLKASLTRQLSELEKREDEDLYRWMQRQQVLTRLTADKKLFPSDALCWNSWHLDFKNCHIQVELGGEGGVVCVLFAFTHLSGEKVLGGGYGGIKECLRISVATSYFCPSPGVHEAVRPPVTALLPECGTRLVHQHRTQWALPGRQHQYAENGLGTLLPPTRRCSGKNVDLFSDFGVFALKMIGLLCPTQTGSAKILTFCTSDWLALSALEEMLRAKTAPFPQFHVSLKLFLAF